MIDTNSKTAITEPECQVQERTPCDTPGAGNCLASGFTQARLPECMDSLGHILDPASLDPGTTDSPLHSRAEIDALLATVSEDQRPCWYLSYDHSDTGCATAPKGQRISALRKTGTVAPPGTEIVGKCLTCSNADPNVECPRLNQ